VNPRVSKELGYLSVIVLGYGVDDWGFESRKGLVTVLTTVSRPVLGSKQYPIQCVPGALSLGIKRPG
jgi:hypothetical protein